MEELSNTMSCRWKSVQMSSPSKEKNPMKLIDPTKLDVSIAFQISDKLGQKQLNSFYYPLQDCSLTSYAFLSHQMLGGVCPKGNKQICILIM